MGKLDGKVAIVSGSGRGIGAEIALKLAADGAALKAPFRILRAAQPILAGFVKRAVAGGEPVPCRKVVNISSIAGLGGNAGQANYAAAKAICAGGFFV
jgi:NAD(P)-dependent dehydrogenase (short-subunit alcohol dehydrogenase family)